MANYQAAPPPAAANDPGRTLGLIGMILAIIPCTSFVGLILSVIALVLSRRVGQPNQKALVGIIVGAVYLVLSFVLNALGVFAHLLQR